jgi:hypothetical protein
MVQHGSIFIVNSAVRVLLKFISADTPDRPARFAARFATGVEVEEEVGTPRGFSPAG